MVLDETVKAIKLAGTADEHEPKDLAEAFLDAMQLNEGVAKAVVEAKGPLNLFKARLGDEWIGQHVPYVQKLVAELASAGRRRQAGGK